MSVRTISRAGHVVGFQAIAGAGGAGKSRYFGVHTHGSERTAFLAARHASERMRADAGPKLGTRGNRGGIPGLRWQLFPSRGDNPPHLHAVAFWIRYDGVPVKRSASANKHGLMGALRIVRKHFERGTRPLGLTDRQLLARMPRPDQQR